MTDRVRGESPYSKWLAALREARERALDEAQQEQVTQLQQQQNVVARPDAYNAGAAPAVDLGNPGAQPVDAQAVRDIALATAATLMRRDPDYISRTFPPEALQALTEDVQTLVQAGATPEQAHQALVDAIGSNPMAVHAMTVCLYQGAYGRQPPEFVSELTQQWAGIIDQQMGGSGQDVADYLGYQVNPSGGYDVPGFVTDESMNTGQLPQQQVPFVDPQDASATPNTGAGAQPSTGVPFFSQLDDRWKNLTLNEAAGAQGGYANDMQNIGCAVTAAAMALSAATGKTITPADLDALNPYGVDEYDRASNGLAWMAIGMAETNWSMDTILRELEAGRPVVVGVDSSLSNFSGSNDGQTNHWVTITGVQKDAQGRVVGFTANDPAQTSGGQMTFRVQGDQLVGTSGQAQYVTTGKLRVVTGEPFQLANGETVRGQGTGQPLTADAGAPGAGPNGNGTVTTSQNVTAVDAGNPGGWPPYPGDTAPKSEIAKWMATIAKMEGLPPELPVMAALPESNLVNNPNMLDHDSVGYFQMRVSIWNKDKYAGYLQDPVKQMRWFVDRAKQEMQENGYSLGDPSRFGEWCANIEQCAERYRYKYGTAENIKMAKDLLAGVTGLEPTAIPGPVAGSGSSASGGGGSGSGVSSGGGGGGGSGGGGSGSGRAQPIGNTPSQPGMTTDELFTQAADRGGRGNLTGVGNTSGSSMDFFANLMRSLTEFSQWLKEEEGKNLARALADNPAFKQFVKQKTGKDLKPGETPSPELVAEFLGQQLGAMDVSQGGPLDLKAVEAELAAGRGQPEVMALMGMLDQKLGLGLGLSQLATAQGMPGQLVGNVPLPAGDANGRPGSNSTPNFGVLSAPNLLAPPETQPGSRQA